jgi:hypothetical protein
MDKIPAALQHKIDYINALDIPTNDKCQRIGVTMVDYWNNNHGGFATERKISTGFTMSKAEVEAQQVKK